MAKNNKKTMLKKNRHVVIDSSVGAGGQGNTGGDRIITWNGTLDDVDSQDHHTYVANVQQQLDVREVGDSKRRFPKNKGNAFSFFNCECGKSSGHIFNPKRLKLLLRLHKKVCKKLENQKILYI